MRVFKSLGPRLLTSLVSIFGHVYPRTSLTQSQVEAEDISLYEPSNELQSRWYEQTQTVYDPLEAMSSLKTHRVQCPQCVGETTMDARKQEMRLLTSTSADGALSFH